MAIGLFDDALAIVEDLELFITGLNVLNKRVGEIGELLFLLTEILPPVGEVLDIIGAALKNVCDRRRSSRSRERV